MDLKGKRVLVTGGLSGLGEAVVQLFAKMGATVCVADLKAASGLAPGLHSVQGDVASHPDVQRITREAVDLMGGIDVLVNSAGIFDSFKATVDQQLASWQRIIDVDLTGTYLMCQAAGAHMVERRSGAIINIASIVGLGGFPRRNAYGASKAGVIMLTQALACEWGATGVRVNCVAPGYIRTHGADTLINAGNVDPDRIDRRTPMGRWGRPEEIAHAVAYLASDWASYVTGATLPVDGGWTAFGGAGDVATA